MTQESPSLITEEMRAGIGREGPPVRHEVDKTGIRMFARAVGHTDLVFYDEEYAKSKGHRSIIAPPSYLGTPAFSPRTGGGGICAGDVLAAVSKTVSIRETKGSLGPMLITQRETVSTHQNGEVVCRAVGTSLNY